MPDVRYAGEIINGVRVVAAPAEIDIITAEQFRAVLLEDTGAGHPTVVVDMTRARFCDASDIPLLRAHKQAVVSQGGKLRLAANRADPDRGGPGSTPNAVRPDVAPLNSYRVLTVGEFGSTAARGR